MKIFLLIVCSGKNKQRIALHLMIRRGVDYLYVRAMPTGIGSVQTSWLAVLTAQPHVADRVPYVHLLEFHPAHNPNAHAKKNHYYVFFFAWFLLSQLVLYSIISIFSQCSIRVCFNTLQYKLLISSSASADA